MELQPASLGLRLELAEALFQGDWYYRDASDGSAADRSEEAMGLCEEVLAAGQEPAELARAHTILGNASFGAGELEQAEEQYRLALESAPDNALAQVGLGNLHGERAQPRRAVAAFSEAVRLDPQLWQARYNLGMALSAACRERDFADCEQTAREAIFQLVSCLKLGVIDGFRPRAWRELGELFLRVGDSHHARRFFLRLVDDPEHGPQAHYFLGLASASLEKFRAARHHFRVFLRELGDERGREAAMAWAKIGLCELELGRHEASRAACQRALAAEPSHVLARFTLACVLRDEGRFEDAAAIFEALLADQPDYLPAYVEWVRASSRGGQRDRVARALGREVQRYEGHLGPEGPRYWYQGARGALRRRVDVLLDALSEKPAQGDSPILETLRQSSSESLRFQLWEQAWELGRQRALEEARQELVAPRADAPQGRMILDLAADLDPDLLMEAFYSDDDLSPDQQRVRRASLLLALAHHASEAVEDFLLEQLDSDPQLRSAATISLLFHGNVRAIEMVEQELDSVEDDRRAGLEELLTMGRGRLDRRRKVVPLSSIRTRSSSATGRRPAPASSAARCSLCSRQETEVRLLVSGNRTLICNVCLDHLDRHRSQYQAEDDASQACQLCGSSVFEVQMLFRAGETLICDGCLDRGVDHLHRTLVDDFLRERL